MSGRAPISHAFGQLAADRAGRAVFGFAKGAIGAQHEGAGRADPGAARTIPNPSLTARSGPPAGPLLCADRRGAAHGAPRTPEDLAAHGCIVDTNRRNPRRWVFHAEGREHAVTVQGRFHVNSASAACTLAEAGRGIAYVPRFALGARLETGALVPLLEGYTGDSTPISAVYLEGRALPRKIRALIEFAAEDIRHAGVL